MDVEQLSLRKKAEVEESMRIRSRLIATDLDGTLSRRTISALRAVREAGMIVVLEQV